MLIKILHYFTLLLDIFVVLPTKESELEEKDRSGRKRERERERENL